mgnify:CR=1 FL=1
MTGARTTGRPVTAMVSIVNLVIAPIAPEIDIAAVTNGTRNRSAVNKLHYGR